MPTQKVVLESSRLDFDAVFINNANPDTVISIDVCLRRKPISYDQLVQLHGLIFDHPKARNYLHRKDLDHFFGASEDDIKLIEEFIEEYQLKITKVDTLTRTIEITGRTVGFEDAFDVQMGVYESVGKATFVSYKGVLSIPSNLQSIIIHVKGLGYPIKVEARRPHKYVSSRKKSTSIKQTGYTPVEIAKAYDFPTRAKGKGQTIGIIELSGRYDPGDFAIFFKKLNLKLPKIIYRGTSKDGSQELSNAEVTLDTEVIGAILPEATIVLYFAHTIIDALKEIIRDEENNPDVISISWAGNESDYSQFDLDELNNLIFEASLLGITIVSAAGDHGAYNNGNNPVVQLPASNPFCLACGGTTIEIEKGQITSEVAWNEYEGAVATGGGFSTLFPLPEYQNNAILRYPFQKYLTRGVPDVSANASMAHGYKSFFEGKDVIIGGTSASTPLWAALIATLNQRLKYRMGFVNKLLYELAGEDCFRQITSGNNQLYQSTEYWSPCCGLGSPHGDNLLKHIKALEPK